MKIVVCDGSSWLTWLIFVKGFVKVGLASLVCVDVVIEMLFCWSEMYDVCVCVWSEICFSSFAVSYRLFVSVGVMQKT